MATLQLNNIMATYNLEISHDKTESMAFCGECQIRSNITLNNETTEKVKSFNYIGCDISLYYDRDLSQKSIQIPICMWYNKENRNKTRKNTMLKFFSHGSTYVDVWI
jgi:hypothetical protein